MSLYVIHRRNPYYAPNTYIECFDYGCQECVMEKVDNRMQIMGHTGIALPFTQLEEYMIKVMNKGVAMYGR